MPESQVVTATAGKALEQKILSRSARVGIVGLGYVGLPLAVEFARAGFHVTGIDLSESKTRRVSAGESYIGDISSATLAPLVQSGKLDATTDFAAVRELDTINICVPTPLAQDQRPGHELHRRRPVRKWRSIFIRACWSSWNRPLIPAPPKNWCGRCFRKCGLEAGKDFFLCFSPERVDPGNPKYQTANIPKVVGGVTPACTEMGALFYAQALQTVVPVSSTQVAEMVKLLENTFRMINIGLVNEIAMMCDRMGIDVWEVIEAAATKPFGFMPFYPGPGLGGHCIPIDPFYLSWKTKQAGIEARFIELAGYINGQMPHFVVDKVQNALNDAGKPVKGSRIHVMGVAYKRDIDDVRESPALDVMMLLERRGGVLTYSDPHVPKLNLEGVEIQASPEEAAAASDCVVIVTDHAAFDYRALVERAPLIVDTRNALKGLNSPKIVRL